MTGVGEVLASLEQLWYIPVRLSPYGARWAALYWQGYRYPLRHGLLTRYTAERDGQQFTVAVLDRHRQPPAFCAGLFERLAPTDEAGSRRLHDPATLVSLDTDLIVAEVHPRAVLAFRAAGWIIIPAWIRWGGAPAAMPAGGSRSLKSDRNKITTYGYTMEPAGIRADWDEFFEHMAIPYAQQRFDEAAWIPSGVFLTLLRRRGTLHFVRRAGDGRRLAGFAALTSSERAWFPVLGTLPDPALRREGILAAIYAFTFDWARAQGFASIDLGRSSALLSDGVGRYKAKWGLQPMSDPVSRLWAVRMGPAVRDLFAREPVYVATSEGLDVYRGTDGGAITF